MKIDAQFSGFLALLKTDSGKAYVQGRLLPALGLLSRKRRRLRAAQLWLTASIAIVALLIPLLALAPLPLPGAVLRFAAAFLGTLIAAALFAQQLLGLPARAAQSDLRLQQLIRLTHAYFLSAQQFSNLSDQDKLARLYAEAEALLA